MTPEVQVWLTAKEAAQYLKIKPRTLLLWVRQGKVKGYALSGTKRLGRQPLSYSYVWKILSRAAEKSGIGHIASHTFRHTYRTWLDSVGTPVGVQQKLMRHADIRTTMNIYGDAMTADMKQANEKITRIAFASV